MKEKEKFKEAKELFENINKDLEKLTELLEEICEEEKAAYTMNLDYADISTVGEPRYYYRLNVSIDKTESVEW